MAKDQLDLIPDERDEIPTSIPLTQETVERWAETGGEWDAIPEVVEALAAFKGQSAQKKRDTVLELVRAELDGRPEESVWKLPTTCNRGTYHHKWKKNKQFVAVLAFVRDAAVKHRSTAQIRHVLQARDLIRQWTTNAALQVAALVGDPNPQISLKAALAILDMTGVSDPSITDADLTERLAPAVDTGQDGSADDDGVSFEEWIAEQEQRERDLAAAEDLLTAWDEDDLLAEIDADDDSR